MKHLFMIVNFITLVAQMPLSTLNWLHIKQPLKTKKDFIILGLRASGLIPVFPLQLISK